MSVLYSQKRKEFKTGDLLAWNDIKIGGMVSFLLLLYQKILKANFNHVGIVVVMSDRYFILEATPPVVRLYPISLAKDFHYIPLNIEENSEHLNMLFRKLGVRYSLFDLITATLRIDNDPTTEYCSELAGAFYNDIGYLENREAGLTPDALVDALVKKSGNEPIFITNDRGNLNAV